MERFVQVVQHELMVWGMDVLTLSIQLYTRWPGLKWSVDTAVACGCHVRHWFLGMRSVPPAPFLATAFLRKDYDIFGAPTLVYTEVTQFGTYDSSAVYDPLYVHILTDGRAIYRHPHSVPKSTTSLCRTPTRFLAVEYAHPDSRYPLALPCPPNAYYADNEVYSPTFVRRELLQTYGVFVPFDDRYKLHLVDHKLEYVSLTAKECVVFTDDGYVVTPWQGAR